MKNMRIVKICALLLIILMITIPVSATVNKKNQNNQNDRNNKPVDLKAPVANIKKMVETEEIILSDDIIIETEIDIIEITTVEPTQTVTTGITGYYEKTYNNGDKYEGNFENGKRSGHGKYTWADGIIYIGEFVNGEPEGIGEYIYPTESTEPTQEPTEPPPTTVSDVPPETSPQITFEPTTAAPPPPPVEYYAEFPKADFISIMFENAIEIPGTEDKIENENDNEIENEIENDDENYEDIDDGHGDGDDYENVSENENENKTVNKILIEPPPDGRSLELQYAAVPLNSNIPEPFGYFKDIIFLGDSVTLGFNLYKSKISFKGENVLRDVTVIASGSYGVYNAAQPISSKSIHPLYGGKQTLPEDIIAEKSAKYVLICLGLNDVAVLSTEKYILYYSNLINRIKEKSPDKTVVIMSVTPLIYAGQKVRLNNRAIAESNNALLQFAKDNNIRFIDYAAAIRDSKHNLYDGLSSDGYCHLTVEAYNRLVEYMLYHPLGD